MATPGSVQRHRHAVEMSAQVCRPAPQTLDLCFSKPPVGDNRLTLFFVLHQVTTRCEAVKARLSALDLRLHDTLLQAEDLSARNWSHSNAHDEHKNMAAEIEKMIAAAHAPRHNKAESILSQGRALSTQSSPRHFHLCPILPPRRFDVDRQLLCRPRRLPGKARCATPKVASRLSESWNASRQCRGQGPLG